MIYLKCIEIFQYKKLSFKAKNSKIAKIFHRFPSKLKENTRNSRIKLKTQEINSKLKEKIQFSGISEASKSWRSAQKKPDVTQVLFGFPCIIYYVCISNVLQGDQNCCLGVSHIKTTPFVQKKSCWLPQDTQGH